MKPQIERLLTPLEASFRFRHFKLKSFEFVWHCHREYELTLISKGSGRRFVGDNISDFYPGDFILTGPGLPHTWYGEHGGEAIVIQFKENFLGNEFFTIPEMKPIKQFLNKASRGLEFEKTVGKIIEKKMKRLESSNFARRIILLLEILETLASAKEYTVLSSKPFSITMEGAKEERIDKVCNFIHNHYLEPITLDQISEIPAMSAQSFCRFFKQATGKVFSDYVNELRISHACMLLIESEKSISEVCFESGFNNLSNFNRHFARLKKMPPRQYRKEFKDR